MKVGISAEKAEQRKPVANVIKLFQRVIYLLTKHDQISTQVWWPCLYAPLSWVGPLRLDSDGNVFKSGTH